MTYRRALTAAAVALIATCAVPANPAEAATVACGDVIVQDTVLSNDVGPCPGTGIVVGDGVTLDLGGHTVSGTGSGSGIEVRPGFFTAVRNGTVTGFGLGVGVAASSARVERLNLTNNGAGVVLAVRTESNVVRETVVRNSASDGILVGGRGGLIERNVISQNGGFGVAVVTTATMAANRAMGNRINANVISGNGRDGVAVTPGSLFTTVGGNAISDNGGNGVRVAAAALPASVSGNTVLGNALNGILVDNQSNETGFIAANSVTSNTARDNGVSSGGFDLADRNPGCAGTAWSANTFVTRSQPCIN